MNEIKFTVFSDLHYWQGYFYSDGFESLEKIREHSITEKSDFVIHLGDFCHIPSQNTELIEFYNGFPIPTYHCPGNHEFDKDTKEQVFKAYGLSKGYYYFEKGGFRFIVLDTNCMRIDGVAVHYSSGNAREHYENKQLLSFDKEQLLWFEDSVMSSPYPCIIFSHHSLERNAGGMSYTELTNIRELLLRMNEDKRRVIMAINGHYHRNNLKIRDGIAFLDLNSVYGEWVSPRHEGLFPDEVYNKYKLAANSVVYEHPLHAIVTVRDDGYIRISGMKSKFKYGVSHKTLGLSPVDSDGRKCEAEILSCELFLPK